jgi:hypothetical protein
MMVMDMKPKQRAKATAAQLDKSDRRKWPALIEAAIRDTENDIIARLSEKLESQADLLSPSSAAAIVREMHRFKGPVFCRCRCFQPSQYVSDQGCPGLPTGRAMRRSI